MTTFGFVLGTYAGRMPARMSFGMSGTILAISVTAMLIMNRFFGVHTLNYYFILVSAIMACNILLVHRLPDTLGSIFMPLSGVSAELLLLQLHEVSADQST